MRRIGIAYRRQLAHWIDSYPSEIGCIEVTAEHFFDADSSKLSQLRQHYPIYLHGLGLSLGSNIELDQHYLEKFHSVCKIAQPKFISEHIAFTKTSEIDLGHLNPIAYNQQSLDIMIDHAQQLAEYCDCPLILENITSHLCLPNSLSETEFLNKLCEQSGCGLLLDVTNLFINSKNHQYDAVAWLNEINPEYVKQLHVVGYSKSEQTYEDNHSHATQQEILELIQHVANFPALEAVIIERDNVFPDVIELQYEIKKIGDCFASH